MDDPKSKGSASNKTGFFYGYIILAAAFLVLVVCLGNLFAFGIFFKPMMTTFNWTRATTSGAFSLAWIVNGLAAIPLGGLNDKFGPRVVITGCGVVLGLGYLLMSQVNTTWHLYLFYGVIIGAGNSLAIPLMSTIARWFTLRRSMMTGILLAGGGVGALAGPPIADFLIRVYDWRLSYAILGITALVVIIPIAQLLRRDPPEVVRTTNYVKGDTVKDLPVRTTEFSPKEAVRTKQFWLAFLMFSCLGFCLYSVQIHLAPHATDLSLSTTTAASILAIMGGMSIAGRVGVGIVGDKIGNTLAFIMTFCLMSASSIWLAFVTPAWGLFLFAVLFGIAYGGALTQQSPLVAKLFGVGAHGLILGVISLGYTIGAALGPVVTGYIFDVYGSYQIAFLITGIIGFMGIILAIALRPTSADQGRL